MWPLPLRIAWLIYLLCLVWNFVFVLFFSQALSPTPSLSRLLSLHTGIPYYPVYNPHIKPSRSVTETDFWKHRLIDIAIRWTTISNPKTISNQKTSWRRISTNYSSDMSHIWPISSRMSRITSTTSRVASTTLHIYIVVVSSSASNVWYLSISSAV